MTDGNPAAIDLLKKPAERLAFLCCGRQAPGGPGLKPPSYQRRFKPCDAGIKPEAGVLHKERFEGVIGKTRSPEVGPYQIGALRRDQTDGVSAGGLPPGGLHVCIDGAADAFRVLFAFLTEDRKRGMIRDSIVSLD